MKAWVSGMLVPMKIMLWLVSGVSWPCVSLALRKVSEKAHASALFVLSSVTGPKDGPPTPLFAKSVSRAPLLHPA